MEVLLGVLGATVVHRFGWVAYLSAMFVALGASAIFGLAMSRRQWGRG